jgi:hypothetical protein
MTNYSNLTNKELYNKYQEAKKNFREAIEGTPEEIDADRIFTELSKEVENREDFDWLSFKNEELKNSDNTNKTITNIIETVKEFNWNLIQIWVENNCIFAEVKKPNGKTEQEGLYAGSDLDANNVYNVFSKLRYALNFNGMLNNDNVMI